MRGSSAPTRARRAAPGGASNCFAASTHRPATPPPSRTSTQPHTHPTNHTQLIVDSALNDVVYESDNLHDIPDLDPGADPPHPASRMPAAHAHLWAGKQGSSSSFLLQTACALPPHGHSCADVLATVGAPNPSCCKYDDDIAKARGRRRRRPTTPQ